MDFLLSSAQTPGYRVTVVHSRFLPYPFKYIVYYSVNKYGVILATESTVKLIVNNNTHRCVSEGNVPVILKNIDIFKEQYFVC
jgi:hypothetical protein